MPRFRTSYVCQQCGYRSPSFLGKCPECGNWNTLVEEVETERSSQKTSKKPARLSEIINISDIERESFDRLSSNIEEIDRVLGGGIVLGSVILVAGDPGIGKSTLLSQLALNVGARGPVSEQPQKGVLADAAVLSGAPRSEPPLAPAALYVAGEESAHQIKLRIDRINTSSGGKTKAKLAILNETDVDVIAGAIEQVKPPMVIVDSIQTMETSDLESAAGTVSQVRESAHRLQKVAKQLHIPIFLVGHVTKEGTVAGPRTLEHIVDVVLSLEGDPATNFRVLRASKNRFGSTDEVGIFEMEENGMVEVKNPSKVFLEGKINAPGSAVTATLTGLRPVLLEIQALVTKTYAPIPRRVATGIDNNRLQLLVAVLQKRLKLPLFDQDIFVNVTGGLKVVEPAVDLAVCMAIISSHKDINLDQKTIFLGEIGLLGELRQVRQLEKRTNEAKKLGFTKIVSPQTAKTLEQVVKSMGDIHLEHLKKKMVINV